MSRHVKDLRLFINFGTSTCYSDDGLSFERNQVIELYEYDASTDAKVPETLDMPDDSSGDYSPAHIMEMVPLQ